MDGYIKLHRKTLENPVVCKDSDHLAIWIYLLLNATHKGYDTTFKGKRITLHPGQLITGRKSIASALLINEYKVQRILKTFETEHQIAQQTTPQNRLISVLNWSTYQSNAQPIEQQMHNGCTTDAHKQECKNDKNEINTICADQFESFWTVYPKKRDKKSAEKCWAARIKEGHSPADLISAASAYSVECKGKDPQFIKYAKTFIGPNTPFLEYISDHPESISNDIPDDAMAPCQQLIDYMNRGDAD